MSITMTRVRRAGLGLIVAAFSVGVVATSTGGTALTGSGQVTHTVSTDHLWGS